MSTHKAAWRTAATFGLMALAGLAAPPSLAAPSDVAYLQTYMGNYRGVGTVSGRDNETINCRMSIDKGNDDKVNYQGRCLLAGANLSIAGTIAFNDAANRYEAVMTSNTAFSGTAIGHRKGDGIVFRLDERAIEKGSDLSIAVGIVLRGGVVNVNFQVVDAGTGDTTRAVVPFKKV